MSSKPPIQWETEGPRVVAMYFDEHRSMQEIGDLYGVSRERIRQVLEAHGPKVDRRALSFEHQRSIIRARDDELESEILQRLEAGETQKQIAAALGIDRTIVRRITRRARGT